MTACLSKAWQYSSLPNNCEVCNIRVGWKKIKRYSSDFIRIPITYSKRDSSRNYMELQETLTRIVENPKELEKTK